MDKAYLKSQWGHYCDTDRLVDQTAVLLVKYKHPCTEHGICSMLDTYFTNKGKLIRLIANHPNYIGDMRIALDVTLERENNRNEVARFCRNFLNILGARDHIVKKVDENGKSELDYLRTGISVLSPSDINDEETREKLKTAYTNVKKFNNRGEYIPCIHAYSKLEDLMMRRFSQNYRSTLSEDVVYAAQNLENPVALTEGMKTSRAFNKVCTTYGLEQLPQYNRLFAEYADSVSGLKRKLKFFVSVNPLDYLTMSFGVNWTSCHTIDKHNVRNIGGGHSGMYCGGTVSYMLDESSFITYVYKDIPTELDEGKIYRNMFHFQNGTLIQGRIYPQGNDGATDLYKEFREIVQAALAQCLETENSWVRSSDNCSSHANSMGVHYQDYCHNSSCNVSYLKKNGGAGTVHIGHERVCPKCGDFLSNSYNRSVITHDNC